MQTRSHAVHDSNNVHMLTSLILIELLADLLWAQSYLTASDPNLIWEDLFESSSGDRMLRLSRRKHVSLDTLNRLVKPINHKTLNYNDRGGSYPPSLKHPEQTQFVLIMNSM